MQDQMAFKLTFEVQIFFSLPATLATEIKISNPQHVFHIFLAFSSQFKKLVQKNCGQKAQV
jgi:hypothetical protein